MIVSGIGFILYLMDMEKGEGGLFLGNLWEGGSWRVGCEGRLKTGSTSSVKIAVVDP